MIVDTAVGLIEQKDDDLVIAYRSSFSNETWLELAPLLAPALQYSFGEYSLEDIYGYCRNEHANLWGYYVKDVAQMAMVTSIITYPGARYFHIMILGGRRLGYAIRMWPAVEKFMQCNDCVRATAYVRPQMARVLQRYQFVEMYQVVGRQSKGVH